MLIFFVCSQKQMKVLCILPSTVTHLLICKRCHKLYFLTYFIAPSLINSDIIMRYKIYMQESFVLYLNMYNYCHNYFIIFLFIYFFSINLNNIKTHIKVNSQKLPNILYF